MFNGCKFINFISEEVCSFMLDRILRLVLIGDFLVRYFFNVLMILFINDY